MKQINFRVSDNQDIIYYDNKPYLLDNLSFVRDERHNCQLIVYAVMVLLDTPPLHLTPSFIDDIERQSAPETVGVCHTCHEFITEADDYASDDEHMYCSDDCYFSRPHVDGYCTHCNKQVYESNDWVKIGHKLYCSDDCSEHFIHG